MARKCLQNGTSPCVVVELGGKIFFNPMNLDCSSILLIDLHS